MSVSNADRDALLTARQHSESPSDADLTPAQQELLRDLRLSLKQMKRGEALPAREALREIQME